MSGSVYKLHCFLKARAIKEEKRKHTAIYQQKQRAGLFEKAFYGDNQLRLWFASPKSLTAFCRRNCLEPTQTKKIIELRKKRWIKKE